MATVHLSSYGAAELAEEMAAKAVVVRAGVNRITRTYGNLLLSRIKAFASGRPGPRIVTGSYNRSWSLIMVNGVGGLMAADVGTNAVQGRRLEYGFVGVDSLGRHYNQPPYPHVRPAADMIEPAYYGALDSFLAGMWAL